MATFAELWAESAPAPAAPVARQSRSDMTVSPATQRERDQVALRIRREELRDSPNNADLQASIKSLEAKLGDSSTFASQWQAATPEAAPAAPVAAPRTVRSMASRLGQIQQNINEGVTANSEILRTLVQNPAATVAGGLAGLVGTILPGPAGQGANWVERVTGALSYEPKSQQAKNVTEALAVPGELAERYITEPAGSAVAQVSPAAGAIVKGALSAAPMALPLRGGARRPTVEVSPARVVPPGEGVINLDVPTQLRQQLEARQAQQAAQAQTAQAQAQPTAAPAVGTAAPADMVGMGAATTRVSPYPAMAGEELARGEAYPVIKLSKIANDVPLAEQNIRAQVASEILGENRPIRPGVVNGSENTLRSEYTEARMPDPTPRGKVLRDQIAEEQNALSNYARNIENQTGAARGLSDYVRGERVNSALATDEGLTGLFKQEKKSIYDEAHRVAGDNPVVANEFSQTLNDPNFNALLKTAGLKDFTGGVKDLLQIHQTTGLPIGKNKVAAPNSIAGLEQLRKNLNTIWKPENSHYVGLLKDAIDADIAKVGGAGLYEKARNLHEFEKTIMGSKAMKSLFGDIGPNGIPKGAAAEKILQKVNDLSIDEWKHVYDTLNNVASGKIRFKNNELVIPDDLRQTAARARDEIQGSLVREIYQAGADKKGEWNSNSANKAMNKLDEKIRYALPPDLQRNLHTLNLGGQIMPGLMSYEGAALQTKRVNAIEKYASKAGATIGAGAGSIFGPTGAAVGALGGERLGGLVSGKATARRESKEAAKLRQQMEANIPKNQLKDIGKKD